jgi:membrane-associated phospholipid phosphatase
MDQKPYAISPLSWGLLGLIIACALAGSVLAGFAFPIYHVLYLVIFVAGFGVIAGIIKALNIKDGDMPYGFILQLIILIPGAIFCQILLCIGASLAFPLVDKQLIAFDHLLGFDWRKYFTWLSQQPLLVHWLDIAYNLMVVEMGVVMCVLCMYRRFRDSERFVMAYLISLVITAVVATLWASVGAYVYYDLSPGDFGLNPPAGRIHEKDLLALRNLELTYFPIVMKGIVSFPSFHTATATLLLWASWPIRWIRLPSLVLNISMIVSTLVGGGHWLADVVGGILVAMLGLVIARKLLPEATL